MAIKLICKTLCTVVFLSSINLYAAGSKVARASAPEANQAQINGAYRDIQPLEQAYISIAPEDRKDGLMVGELGIDGGGNSALMVNLAEEIGEGKHSDFDSLLIVHQGKLLFESYYSRGRINLPHYQASATKAYTGLALGRAIQLGYLTMADLDKPLISFLKDLDTKKLVKGAEKVTLHKALTMHSGIRLSREQKEMIEKDPTKITGQAHVQAYLEHSTPITSESQTFRYQADPMLVMQVIEAVVPGSAEDFIKKELLDKLGITNYLWRTDINGLPVSGSRTTMTSRDMVKWGLLTKNKGKWNGEQLIPEAYINRAANRVLLTGDDDIFGGGKDVFNQGYGYYWWSADMKYGGKKYFTRSAQGGGGQYIILIDELDLMVVVTANNRNDTTLQLTAERILPAFVK